VKLLFVVYIIVIKKAGAEKPETGGIIYAMEET
jgi:hypothetical protein